jgi:hypothetical protein
LIDASTIYGQKRGELKETVLAISIEGLMPAFEHLKRIKASPNEALPELNRRQLYEDFSRVLWHAYKDLMQKATTIMEPDFGFLFKKDRDFEAGLTAWVGERPTMAPAAPYLRALRATWQNALGDFRNNYLEHRGDQDWTEFASRYDPAHAAQLFDSVWRAIADILAMLVSLHLPSGTSLVEIRSSAERRETAPVWFFRSKFTSSQRDVETYCARRSYAGIEHRCKRNLNLRVLRPQRVAERTRFIPARKTKGSLFPWID